MKKLSRELEATLRSAEILFTWSHNVATKIDNQAVMKTLESSYAGLSKARRNLALFQHHDAITGKLFCLSGNVLPLKDLFRLFTYRIVEGVTKKSRLTNCRFATISSQISAIYMNIFHKTEVQTVILRC